MAPDAQVGELRALLEEATRLRRLRAWNHAGADAAEEGAETPWS